MTTPPTEQELKRVHTALRLATPFEKLSPLMLQTITVIARCWNGDTPKNLFPTLPTKAPRVVNKKYDAKMRSANDWDVYE